MNNVQGVQNGIRFEGVFQLGKPNSICRVFAQKPTVGIQDRDTRDPKLFRLLFQALGIGKIERGVIGQLVHRSRLTTQRLGRSDVIVLLVAGGLRFDEVKRLAKELLCDVQLVSTRYEDDACHEEHADDEIDCLPPRG